MKKAIFLFMLMIVSGTSFSQQSYVNPVTSRENYLRKSNGQKTAAWLLAGVGVGFVVAGAATGAKEYANELANFPFGDDSNPNTGATLFAIGGVSALSSIPLFIASGRNKRKAMSLTFKNETAPQIQKSSFVYRSVPSLTLKIVL